MSFSSSLVSPRLVSIVLWVAAFISSLYIVNDWQLGFFATSVTLLFLWAWTTLCARAGQGWVIPRSPVLGFAAAFWALAFASIFWSELPLVSLSAFCFFSAMPLTLFVFILNQDEKQFKIIGYILAVLFTVLGVWAVIQYCIGFNPFGGQARHPLADPNALGGMFNLGFIPAVGWMVLTKDKRQSVAAFVLAAVIFAGMLATGSRGAFFSLIPAFGLFMICGWHFMKQHRRCLGLLALVLGLLFVASSFTGKYEWNKPTYRIAETVMLSNPDVTNNRMNIWDGAIEVVKHHWLKGTGIGTFFLYYPEHRSPAEHVGVSHAHSDPIQYWAEMGILSVILFYGFLIAALVRTWKVIKVLAKDDPLRILILAPVCALGAVVIHAHVNFNFYNLVILFGAGFLIAVWFAMTQRIIKDKTIVVEFPPTMKLSARQFMLILPFLPLLFLFGAYMTSEHYVNAARDSLFADGDLQGFAHNLQVAHSFDHGLNFRTWLLAANIPLGILQESLNEVDDKQKLELYKQASAQLDRVVALNPRSASARYYQARLQGLAPSGAVPPGTPSPEKLYKEALKLDPLHLGARMALADIYEARKDEDAAMKILDEGFEYNYGSSRAMGYYGRVMVLHLARGEKEMYQKAMNKMAQFRSRMETSEKMDRKARGVTTPVGQEDVLK
jgi:O-antigen ligase